MPPPRTALRSAAALACALAAPWTALAATDHTDQKGGVDARDIETFVEHALLAQLRTAPVARGAQRVEVDAGALDSRLSLAACDAPLKVEADLSRQSARVNARVSCAAPSPWSIYVPAVIHVFRPVVVAARDLGRGEAIGPADVAVEERDALAVGAPPLTDPGQAIGLTARKPVAAHTVLSENVVEMPIAVRRGDRISVTAQSGDVAVRITGEALGTARRGERVRVRNVQSGQVIDAVATGSGTADAI